MLGGVLVALLGVRAVAGATLTPRTGSWLGFGTGYTNPVVEADFLAQERLGDRFYNIFDSGGYLLWRLHPQYAVMVDSRSYPYLDWFAEQQAFTEGRDVERFVEKYPAEVAVIDLDKQGTWQSFLELEDWRPVFYGPTAAVLVKDPDAALLDPDDRRWEWTGSVRNADSALDAFEFATSIGDFRTAWTLLDRIDGGLSCQRADAGRSAAAHAYRAAYRALADREYALARGRFATALRDRVVGEQDALVLRFLDLRDEAVDRDEPQVPRRHRDGLRRAGRTSHRSGARGARVTVDPTAEVEAAAVLGDGVLVRRLTARARGCPDGRPRPGSARARTSDRVWWSAPGARCRTARSCSRARCSATGCSWARA